MAPARVRAARCAVATSLGRPAPRRPLRSAARALARVALLLLAIGLLRPAAADTPVTLFQSFAGNIDFISTAGTFRTQSDAVNACAIQGTATATLPALPSGAVIQAAYLYYGHSVLGLNTTDPTVTFGFAGTNTNVTADRTFTSRFAAFGQNFDFAGGFEDVTGLVSASTFPTTVTLSNLTINNGAPVCGVNGVMGGFSLVVIFSEPSEDFRVINVFDGFQAFRNGFLDLTPNNFLIPASPINGKQLVVTWEGDIPPNGGAEAITYNGTSLPVAGDPFNGGGVNPANNQFNSTITGPGFGATGISNVFGVDNDTYQLDTLLAQGQTSGTTRYLAGGDLVFLTAEVISVTNTPVSDLAITKSHVGDFTVGTNGSYTLSVTNNGPVDETGTITVTDDLNTTPGLGFVSATGTGWSCGEAGGVVTCTRTGLANGVTAPPITLTVSVGEAAVPAVTNTATVVGQNFDNVAANDSSDDPTTVLAPDLSTSTKGGVDENGGDLENADTILYTITLNETNGVAADDVQVVDDLDANVGSFVEVTVPAGATAVFTPGAGANGTGQWSVTGIDVPANGSITLQFRVSVTGAADGEGIDNAAVVTGLAISETLNAPTLVVAESALPSTGIKQLYFEHTETGGADDPVDIGRDLPTVTNSTGTRVDIEGDGDSATWTLAPTLTGDLTFDQDITVVLFLREAGPGNQRPVLVEILQNGTPILSQTQTLTLGTSNSNPNRVVYDAFAAPGTPITVSAGDTFAIRITNTVPQANRDIRIFARSQDFVGTEFEKRTRILLDADTIINVDSVETFDAASPGGVATTVFSPAETVFVRAVVSDPFGADDITSASLEVLDGSGAIFATIPMFEIGTAAGSKTFEASLTPAVTDPVGNWTLRVTATEGVAGEENTDLGVGTFLLAVPDFILMKSSPQVISDPVNGTSNPKRLPGAVVLYRIQLTNDGQGRPTDGTVRISDALPGSLQFGVPPSGDVLDAIVPSANLEGLTFDPATGVTYTLSSGTEPVDADPPPSGDGCYDNVTGFSVLFGGQMNARVPPAAAPVITLSYRACIQ